MMMINTFPPSTNQSMKTDFNFDKKHQKWLLMEFLSSHSKTFALQIHHRFNHTHKYQRTQNFFLLLLSLVSLYYLTSNSIDFIWVFAFFTVLLGSFILALTYLRNLSQNQSIPVQISSDSNQNLAPTVVWSIGSNPKWEKTENSGCWVKVFCNGDVYQGEFCEGKCSGSGVYHYYMCGKYEGDWVNGKFDGFGVESWAKGSKYKGGYKNGLRHGIGLYNSYTGDVYEGEWSNGKSHGFGVYTSKDGSKYVGEFKWGVKHGFGHYHYRNGDVYAGEYFADKMHGFGVYKFGNGHLYEGSWHEGRQQGLGVYTFRNGETQSGYWQNSFLGNNISNLHVLPGSPFSANPCQVSTVIQEAKQASERAYNVTSVKDRVKRAVLAANRAATTARVVAATAVQKRMHQGIHNEPSFHMFD